MKVLQTAEIIHVNNTDNVTSPGKKRTSTGGPESAANLDVTSPLQEDKSAAAKVKVKADERGNSDLEAFRKQEEDRFVRMNRALVVQQVVKDERSAEGRMVNRNIEALGEAINEASLRQLEIETKYAGYIKRQDAEIEKIRRHEGLRIPQELSYDQIDGLSNELRQKLTETQPETLARAARIPGMTPAALSIVMVHAKKVQG